jgi:3-hydroxybutyryl-CoA dehydrogenase
MTRLGVVGAGTMGAGIAQVAAQQGLDVVLVDLQPDFTQGAVRRIAASLDRAVERGRLSESEAEAAVARIEAGDSFGDLGGVECVIEAVNEDFAVKSRVFADLDEACAPETLLASNTSSFSVTEIGAATRRADRVVGMHFFNPVPAMALVEVVQGAATSEENMKRAIALARELGKTPVRASDSPGFIVNRVVRPFYNEALRILSERLASPEVIDRSLKGLGFRMGPYELMDLIGNDVNLAVTTSIFDQLYGEPRVRPSFAQRQLVRSGQLGQKTGRGWYAYGETTSSTPAASTGSTNPHPKEPVVVIVDSVFGRELVEALRQAGVDVRSYRPSDQELRSDLWDSVLADAVAGAATVVGTSIGSLERKRFLIERMDAVLPAGVPILSLAVSVATTEIASWCQEPERVCGFGYVPPLDQTGVVEVAPGLRTGEAARQAAGDLVRALGKESVTVGDSTGLVGARILTLLINEAAWALMEGVASAEDIDIAVRLGANYPHGLLEWADVLGIDLVYTLIDGMAREFGEDRYRPAPLLRKMALAGWTGRSAGRGFFVYS